MIAGKLTVCCGFPCDYHAPASTRVGLAGPLLGEGPGAIAQQVQLEQKIFGVVLREHARRGDHPLCAWWDCRDMLGHGPFLMKQTQAMGWPVVEATFVCEQCGVRWTTRLPAFMVSTFALVGHSRHEGHFMRVLVKDQDGVTWDPGVCPSNEELKQSADDRS